ncbi:MAG TPA: DUF1707 domain-containing protein [Streptosporangiaceae bacterium]|nr:DUF1707 domain-containing protein [Streptosporangiaceae bacterium]
MDRTTATLTGLLARLSSLLPAGRRDWAEALLAEAAEVPPGAKQVAWLCGGLWLVAREVAMGNVIRACAFAAGAVGLVWIGWPGASSNSATPLNRVYVTGAVVLLAAVPLVVRRYFGPVRRGWAPRAARVCVYAIVLMLIAAKAVKDRDGSKLGTYFAIVPAEWILEILLLLVIVGYVAGLFILTSQRIRLSRWSLPIGIGLGVVTAGALYPLARFGFGSAGRWWGLAALVLPLVTSVIAGRLAVRDTRPGVLGAFGQGCLAASCATATGALLLAALTSATIALFPHQVGLEADGKSYIAAGGCETCDPVNTVIPRNLRHEYWVEISVGQAGTGPLAAILIAPFLGAGLGTIGAGLAGASGRRRRAGSGAQAAALPASFGQLAGRASDADRDRAIGVLKTAFEQGRLTKDEFDVRVGRALSSRTYADLGELTVDVTTRLQPGG